LEPSAIPLSTEHQTKERFPVVKCAKPSMAHPTAKGKYVSKHAWETAEEGQGD